MCTITEKSREIRTDICPWNCNKMVLVTLKRGVSMVGNKSEDKMGQNLNGR